MRLARSTLSLQVNTGACARPTGQRSAAVATQHGAKVFVRLRSDASFAARVAPDSFTTHTKLKSVKSNTSHTSQPLHSHARDMQRIHSSHLGVWGVLS